MTTDSRLLTTLPPPHEFEELTHVAREQLTLVLAYKVAHHRLALADVVVRAAMAFTGATEAEASELALENLFDAVKHFKSALENSTSE